MQDQRNMNNAVNWLAVTKGVGVLSVQIAHTALVLFWRPIRWVLTLCILHHSLKTMYLWGEPGNSAGWTAAMVFALMTALTWVVGYYKPPTLKRTKKISAAKNAN